MTANDLSGESPKDQGQLQEVRDILEEVKSVRGSLATDITSQIMDISAKKSAKSSAAIVTNARSYTSRVTRNGSTVMWILDSVANVYTVGSDHKDLVVLWMESTMSLETTDGTHEAQMCVLVSPRGLRCGLYVADAPALMPMRDLVADGQVVWGAGSKAFRISAEFAEGWKCYVKDGLPFVELDMNPIKRGCQNKGPKEVTGNWRTYLCRAHHSRLQCRSESSSKWEFGMKIVKVIASVLICVFTMFLISGVNLEGNLIRGRRGGVSIVVRVVILFIMMLQAGYCLEGNVEHPMLDELRSRFFGNNDVVEIDEASFHVGVPSSESDKSPWDNVYGSGRPKNEQCRVGSGDAFVNPKENIKPEKSHGDRYAGSGRPCSDNRDVASTEEQKNNKSTGGVDQGRCRPVGSNVGVGRHVCPNIIETEKSSWAKHEGQSRPTHLIHRDVVDAVRCGTDFVSQSAQVSMLDKFEAIMRNRDENVSADTGTRDIMRDELESCGMSFGEACENAASALIGRIGGTSSVLRIGDDHIKNHHVPYDPRCPICVEHAGRDRRHVRGNEIRVGEMGVDLCQVGHGDTFCLVGAVAFKSDNGDDMKKIESALDVLQRRINARERQEAGNGIVEEDIEIEQVRNEVRFPDEPEERSSTDTDDAPAEIEEEQGGEETIAWPAKTRWIMQCESCERWRYTDGKRYRTSKNFRRRDVGLDCEFPEDPGVWDGPASMCSRVDRVLRTVGAEHTGGLPRVFLDAAMPAMNEEEAEERRQEQHGWCYVVVPLASKRKEDVIQGVVSAMTDAESVWKVPMIRRVHGGKESGLIAGSGDLRQKLCVSVTTTRRHEPKGNGRAGEAIGKLTRGSKVSMAHLQDAFTRRKLWPLCMQYRAVVETLEYGPDGASICKDDILPFGPVWVSGNM